jgi:hypothetical protein
MSVCAGDCSLISAPQAKGWLAFRSLPEAIELNVMANVRLSHFRILGPRASYERYAEKGTLVSRVGSDSWLRC